MARTLHKLDDEFDDRNLFLQVALGLVSACAQFDSLVALHGSVAAASALPAAARSPDDPVLDALLGLVALSQCLMAHLNAARSAAPAEAPAAAAPAARAPRRLRDLLE